MRYITNQPQPGITNGFVELGANGVSGGSFGGNARFAINVPISETAALRVASYYSRLPGFIDAVQPNLTVKKDVNDGFRTGVRAAVRLVRIVLRAGSTSTCST